MSNKSMDIYSKPGTKVILTDSESGWPHDHDQLAKLGLVKGAVYTVDNTEVDSSSTKVFLREYPGARFNSVNFSNIPTPIVKNSIVKYKGGWYRTFKVTKRTANLRGVFGGHIIFKAIPLDEMVEDDEGFMAYWTQTEAYKSM